VVTGSVAHLGVDTKLVRRDAPSMAIKSAGFEVWAHEAGERRDDALSIGGSEVGTVEDAALAFAMARNTDGVHRVEDIDGVVWEVTVSRSGPQLAASTPRRVS
jgi:hypothetical protein